MGALCIALLGLVFCVWNASDSSTFCVTNGCSLYADTTIIGISMWWFGCAAFASLAFLALLRKLFWGMVLANLYILCDCVLLLILALTAPCGACLIVAFFFALSCWSFRSAYYREKRQRRSFPILLVLWVCLLSLNLGLLFHDSIGSWSIYGNEDAPVQIYFSPSCAACRQLVEAVNDTSSEVVLYPVSENNADTAIILTMRKNIESGMRPYEALGNALDNTPHEGWSAYASPSRLYYGLRLTRNQAHVRQSGANILPYVEFRGLPHSLIKPAQSAQAAPEKKEQPYQSLPQLLPDFGVSGGCSQNPTDPVCTE